MKRSKSFKYSRETRYLLFFLTLFFMIFTVKVYINNFNIESSIDNIKLQVQNYKEKTAFLEKFYKNYLSWDKSNFFSYHEENIPLSNEYIVKFKEKEASKSEKSEEKEKKDIVNVSDPKDAWRYFLKNKLTYFKKKR